MWWKEDWCITGMIGVGLFVLSGLLAWLVYMIPNEPTTSISLIEVWCAIASFAALFGAVRMFAVALEHFTD